MFCPCSIEIEVITTGITLICEVLLDEPWDIAYLKGRIAPHGSGEKAAPIIKEHVEKAINFDGTMGS